MNNKSLTHKQDIASTLTDIAFDNQNIKMVANKGYVVAPQKILRCYRLSEFEKVLFLDLMSYIGDDGYAWPSHGHLALKHGKKSTASIKATLNSLRDKGFIYWHTGGGDFGTNHYYLKDLYYNPYLIMSELTHYCVSIIRNKYRSRISYDTLFTCVLNFVNSSQKNEEDVYGKFLDTLFKDKTVRDSYQFYVLYAENLNYYIESNSKIVIEINWFAHFVKFFQKNFTKIPVNFEVDEYFKESIGNPYGKTYEREYWIGFWEFRKQVLHEISNYSEEKLWGEIENVLNKEPDHLLYIDCSPDLMGRFLECKKAGYYLVPILKKILSEPNDPIEFLTFIESESRWKQIKLRQALEEPL